MKVRRILFWIHLSAGTLAGCVIFVMSVTGVMLAFQRQIVQWSDSRYRIAGIFDERRIPIDVLANNLRSSQRRGLLINHIAIRPAFASGVQLWQRPRCFREPVYGCNPRRVA